ncbi:MAG: hypothetical protein Q8J69_07575 [Sphingobacteriaceae bacterium]|nr:hypothetical protein [Sphingobacteriaceae bacterium]
MINQPLSITLNFSDIQSFADIEKLKNQLKTGGVYIWGFVFDKEEPFGIPMSHTEVFDFNMEDHVFVPYYVGKSETNIAVRLKDHKSSASKRYLQLEPNYLKSFFNDFCFPEHLDGPETSSREWFINHEDYFKSRIVYYKSKPILDSIYDLNDGGPFALKSTEGDYTFEKLINALKSRPDDIKKAQDSNKFYNENYMFFTYANIECSFLSYEYLETYIFYSLKGKTIGKHKKFDFLTKSECFGSLLIDFNCKDIVNYLFKKDGVSRNFPGY